MTELLLILVAALSVGVAWLVAALRGRLARQEERLGVLLQNQDKTERAVREEAERSRGEATLNAKLGREELSGWFKQFSELLLAQLNTLTQSNEQKLERLRETVEQQLRTLQEDNSKKLEQMRETVDEKLHATLEQRLGESFKLVSERLELVHKGLGEMQSLAAGVGDLKNVLVNVKTRGTWGEVQLRALLAQVLTPAQYVENVATKEGSGERVEFALKLPEPDRGSGEEVLVPLDAKFPQEDYQRLVDALEKGDTERAEKAARQLETRIKAQAKDIRDKYVNPPRTTDFAILFLPTEGLYAEVLRIPGLFDALRDQFHVLVTGPTTLLALLTSLQLGFRTVAFQKQSKQVWELLQSIKTEFGKFGDLLDKTHKKLEEAANTIDDARRKSRTIERRLKKAEELPAEAGRPLALANRSGEDF